MKYILLIAIALMQIGCVSARAQSEVAAPAQFQPTELQKRQIATAMGEFPQEGNSFEFTGLVYGDYVQIKVTKLHGTVKVFYLWINSDCKLFDRPYTNDGTPMKVPGIDIPINKP